MIKNLLKESPLMQSSYDRFLTTLKNQVRFTIVQALISKPKNVSQLTSELNIHQTTVSHGLRRLLDCGFVFVERNGKERIYSVNRKTIKPLIELMENHVNTYCKRCFKK
ncbi:MAG: helix-turn-helix transcriptional regulator [Nanoarchaeota archaeon]|nr:helix-turn-helix transcriptional regulator [Nanoarchaeota archaeon]